MATLDYIVLAIVLISALTGLVRGFLREVCSLLSWILAFWLAWKLGPLVEPYLGGTLRQAPYGLWAGRAIVFIAVLIVGAIIGAAVNYFVRLSMFSGLDRLLGFVLGLFRGVVAVGVAIVLAQAVHLDGESWWKKSRLIPHMESVADLLRALAGDRIPPRAGNDG
jgi:membrane protein required for colicin V production